MAGLTALTANSYKEIERQLELGNRNKSVASTHMNDVSSRAHTIFQIKFSQTQLEHLGGETGLAREVGVWCGVCARGGRVLWGVVGWVRRGLMVSGLGFWCGGCLSGGLV